MNKSAKDKQEYNEKYRQAGIAFGKGVKQVWKGVTGQQGVMDATLNTIGSTLQAFGYVTQGVCLEMATQFTILDKKSAVYRILNDPEFEAGKKQFRQDQLAQATEIAANMIRERERYQQKLEKKRNPGTYRPARTNREGTQIEQTLTLKCQNKGCVGCGEFQIASGQLEDIRQRFNNDPKNCDPCKHYLAAVYSYSEQAAPCEKCGEVIIITNETWEYHFRTKGRPYFKDFCPYCPERKYQQAKAKERRFALEGAPTYQENLNFEVEYEKKYGGSLEENPTKEYEFLSEKIEQNNPKSKTNYQQLKKKLQKKYLPAPIADLIPIKDYYRLTTDGGVNTIAEHLESHITGVRNGESSDASLKGEFKSVEEIIIYAHYVAGLTDSNRFLEKRSKNGDITRYDLKRNLKIIYSGSTPSRVRTVYRPTSRRYKKMSAEFELLEELSKKL